MKSYKIDSYFHIIETSIPYPTRYGYEDRFSFQIYNGIIEATNSHFLYSLIGCTIDDAESFILYREDRFKKFYDERKEQVLVDYENLLVKADNYKKYL